MKRFDVDIRNKKEGKNYDERCYISFQRMIIMSNEFYKIYIGAVCVLCIVVIIITIIRFKWYYVPKTITGEIILKLQRSNRVIAKKGVAYVVVLCMMNFRLSDTELGWNNLLSLVLSVFILAQIAWFDFQPQKICGNGILIKTGFISWDKIKKVEPVSEMDDTISLQLYEPRFGGRKIDLYCLSGMAENIELLINQHIKVAR